MESKNLLTLAITLTVGIILAGSLLMPVISDATTTEKTFQNEGAINLNYVDETFEEVIVWDYTTPTKLTIGEDVIDLPTNLPFALTFMTNENFFARYYYSASNSFIQVYKTGTGSAYQASVTNSQNMTITISGGSIVFDNGGSTTTTVADFGNMYCICAEEGSHVMKLSADKAYLKSGSDIFAYGQTYIAGVTFNTIIEGTPADGFDRTVWPDTIPMTYTDLQDDLTAIDGYIGLYTLKDFKYTVTNTNTGVSANVTYGQFIVPSKVTVELSQHLAPGEIAILNALPILIITALVVMAAGALYLKRDD